MAKHFLNLGKQTSRPRKPREFHYERNPKERNPKQPTLRKITIKSSKFKTRRDSKSARRKQLVTYKGILIKLLPDFSPETFQAIRK